MDVDVWMYALMYACKDGWMEVRMCGRTDGRMNKWMDACMNGKPEISVQTPYACSVAWTVFCVRVFPLFQIAGQVDL